MSPHFTIPTPATFAVRGLLSERIMTRDGARCVYCGRDDVPLTVDHVTPCAHFPANAIAAVVNAPANLVTACEHCNGAKGAQDLGGFARMLLGRGLTSKITTAMVRRVHAATRRPLPSLSDP